MSRVVASPELLAIARRWIDAIPNRRPNDLRNLLTERDYLRFVGTGENEIWAGPSVREGIGEFFGDIPDLIRHEETFAEAYEHNGTGWACMCHELVFAPQPDRVFQIRSTLIFTLEDGAWKIVHRHGSVPIPNMDFTGAAQTAIADLVAAAKQGFSLDQREGFASAMGDRLWSSEVARHFNTLREIIEARGVQFVKSLGDGTMSSFPSPEQGLRAAQAKLRATEASDGPSIALRIGLHTGEVVENRGDFFGTVVNKAARIASFAGAGDILLSDSTRKMVGSQHDFDYSESIATPLKGLEGDHVLYHLTGRPEPL
ncbi:nuclear transport factor 2 family protein [Ruegeria pomeroyi]|uniref:nuclear transport factor 2 family protein n=1 Tax=Ruegeria pomeroyi TaxID=89184 RepID=UPI001F2E9308|nr:nuclear transport factor 2 family protein [Ruegeria pomeroyi]MCE8509507.1 nuclear transport factor 2 family protein [Ruegeria pomeroyi]